MIDYDASFTFTDGAVFPDTAAVNASIPSAQDGTEFTKAMVDDIWGFNQALLDHAGMTPDGFAEAAGASQRLEALQKAFIGPGEIVEWNLAADPATAGRRRLLLNGQGILRANYVDLDAAVYVGDANNAAVEAAGGAYYRADDAAGTIPNIAGVYLILPDRRGYVPRGLDLAASVDPDGAGRYIGDIQNDAFQGHIFYSGAGYISDVLWVYGGTPNETPGTASFIISGISVTSPSRQGLTSLPKTDGVNGTPRTDSETRMVNVSTQWAIVY